MNKDEFKEDQKVVGVERNCDDSVSNNFYIYSTNIDVNSIWNTNEELKRCYSPPTQSVVGTNGEIEENECLNTVWNSELVDSMVRDSDGDVSKVVNSNSRWGVRSVNQGSPWEVPGGPYGYMGDGAGCGWGEEAVGSATMWPPSGYGEHSPVETVWSDKESVWTSAAVPAGVLVGPPKGMQVVPKTTRSVRPESTNEISRRSRWPSIAPQRTVGKSTPMLPSLCGSALSSSSSVSRLKDLESEITDHHLYVVAQMKLLELYQRDLLKVQVGSRLYVARVAELCAFVCRLLKEIDRNVEVLRKRPEVQVRPALNELLLQRQTILQRSICLQTHLDAVSRRLYDIEGNLGSVGRVRSSLPQHSPSVESTLVSKMGSMKVAQQQQRPNFRLDVPEFVPGKRWCGLSQQKDKENCSPSCLDLNTAGAGGVGARTPEATCLMMQNMPSHITVDMLQTFFAQNNIPCVPPMHCNPFSRWVIARFPTQAGAQRACQLLSGKVGLASLISDEEARFRLEELKGMVAQFVAH